MIAMLAVCLFFYHFIILVQYVSILTMGMPINMMTCPVDQSIVFVILRLSNCQKLKKKIDAKQALPVFQERIYTAHQILTMTLMVKGVPWFLL